MLSKEKVLSKIKGVFDCDVNDEKELLKVYCTCVSVHNQYCIDGDIKKAYVTVMKESSRSEMNSFMKLNKKLNWDKLVELSELFSDLPFIRFLLVFTPHLVCNPKNLCEVKNKNNISMLNICTYIIAMSDLDTDILKVKISSKKEFISRINSSISKLICFEGISKNAIYELFCSVCLYDLSQKEIQQTEKTTTCIEKFKRYIRDNRGNDKVKEFIEEEKFTELYLISESDSKINAFCRKNGLDKKEVVKYSNKTKRLPLLDFMRAVSYDKKSNDILLENGYVYDKFIKSYLSKDNPKGLIIEPSDFLIPKILSDTFGRHINFTIVLSSSNRCKMYKRYISTRNNSSSLLFDFLTPEEFFGSTEKYDGVLMFTTRMNKDMQKEFSKNITAYCNYDTEMYSFHSSNDFENELDPLSQFMLTDAAVIERIDILPTGIENATEYKKKLLVCFSLCGESDNVIANTPQISLNKFGLIKCEKNLIFSDKQRVYVHKCELIESNSTLRQLFREKSIVNISGKSRECAKEYVFSEELSAFYTTSAETDDPDKVRLRIYLKETGTKAKIIAKSVSKHRIAEENIYDFIENEYFYRIVQGVPIIREQLRHIYFGQFEEKDITLKSFVYLYCEWEKWQVDDIELFENVLEIINSSVGNLRIRKSLADDYVSSYSELVLSEDIDITAYLNILSNILNVAVNQGFLIHNVLEDYEISAREDEKSHFNYLREMQGAFAKRTLTFYETNMLIELVESQMVKGKYEYLGILIKLFTGLKEHHICALFWSDLVYSEKHRFYILYPSYEVKSDGFSLEAMVPEVCRGIPCIPVLSKWLLRRKEELQKIYTEEIIANMPIVPAIDKKRSIYANTSPVHLRELCKKTLSFIESEPEVIRTIDGELVVKPYRGDFLISTFRYWLMMYTDLTFNEYCVLAGLKVYETVDGHYIDYCNHSVLFQLYKKMIKIEDKFKEEKGEQYNG